MVQALTVEPIACIIQQIVRKGVSLWLIDWLMVQALAVEPIPRIIQQIVRKGVSLCDDWQDLIKYLNFFFKTKKDSGDKAKKGTGNRQSRLPYTVSELGSRFSAPRQRSQIPAF